MSKETLPPLVGRNPIVHLAGIAQSMEQSYAAAVTSSYRDAAEKHKAHEWAAQACALFDLVEHRGFDAEALEFYRTRLDGYRVELALRYAPDEKEADGDE